MFNNGKPILVLEPGRAIVDECMQLISKIVSKKKDPMDGHENFKNIKDKYDKHFSEKPGK